MASDSFKVKKSLNIESGGTASANGDVTVNSNKLEFHNGTSSSPVVTEAHTQTLTNKTIDADNNTITNIANDEIKASAAIALDKLAATTASRALVSDASGFVSAATTTSTEIGYVNGVTSAIQTQIDAKAPSASPTFSGTITTPLTASRALATGASSELAASATTATELGYVSGVTSAIQTQLDGKVASGGALGTPSSGTLTNCTGLPLTTGVTGTLADDNGGTGQSTYTTGDILYASATNTLSKLTVGSSGQVLKVSGGVPAWAAAPSGGINYLAPNQDAEVDTTGWSTYADAAGVLPVDGTGGSPNTTWTRTTSSPMRGTGSYLWTKSSGASRQGEGVSFDFTIDEADKAKVLAINFDYIIASGTFTASDGTTAPSSSGTSTTAGDSTIRVFVYDVTNSVLIPVSPSVLTSNSTSIPATFKGVFQTSADSTSYRLILHTSYTTDAAMTAKFDNFYVGPQSVAYGYAGTDDSTQWFSSSNIPAAFGTPSNVKIFARRVGDNLRVHGSFQCGTVAGSTAYLSLSSIVMDTAKLGTTGADVVGYWYTAKNAVTSANWSFDGSTANLSGNIFFDGSTNNQVFFGKGAASNTYTKVNGSTILANSDSIGFVFEIPIAGWSSNVLMSNDANTRVVAAVITGTPASATATNPVIFPTVSSDTHGAYNASTGLYTAPVSGYYQINTYMNTSIGANTILYAYVDGSAVAQIGYGYSSSGAVYGSGLVKATAGQTISVRLSQNSGTFGSGNYLQINILSGPAAIAATENVFLQYTGNGGGAVTANTTNVDFTTKVVDSHNAWSGSVFTAPRAGFYLLQGGILTTTSSANLVQAYQNGSAKVVVGSNHTSTDDNVFSGSIYLLAGDTLSVRLNQSLTLSNSATRSWISISSQ